MASPTSHSLLSPSNAHRWLACTAAPRFEEQFPDNGTSTYAEEGTLAHAICELHGRRQFRGLDEETFRSELEQLQQNELYNPEMLDTAQEYVNCLMESMNSNFHSEPFIAFEENVDLTDWIPQGRGQCDCIMIGSQTLQIWDYKHGRGVAVDALGNPQMRLYALGALKKYYPAYGNTITRVVMSICQPRLPENARATVSAEEQMPVWDLLEWGETVKPKAKAAFDGKGEFCAGEHCRFCRGKAVCPARAKENTALEDFKDLITPNKALNPLDPESRKVLGLPAILTDAEVGDLLRRGETLVNWYNDLRDYAVEAMLAGKTINGWKLVEGRSNRAFDDADAAIEKLIKAGYSRDQLYKTEPQSLTTIEKLVGKKKFAELVGDRIVKPRGKATLAGAEDPREAYGSAAADFSEVVKNG